MNLINRSDKNDDDWQKSQQIASPQPSTQLSDEETLEVREVLF